MKLVVMTDDDRLVASFDSAEEMDYLDYGAELDDALAAAARLERRPPPRWLTRPQA